MTKFLIVDEAPKELKKGEIVIDKPNFMEEIAQQKAKTPRNGITGLFHLRAITALIAQNYDPSEMTEYSVKAHAFEGRPFSNDEELNNIIVEMIRINRPQVFTKYLDKKIKTRPVKTDLIYIVRADIPFMYETLYQNGIGELIVDQPKEDKPKKTVGKPAVTKEQAEALKNQADS
jgi:hypothetical protein